MFVLIAVNYEEQKTDIIVKGTEELCKARAEEIGKDIAKYLDDIATLDAEVESTRPKVSDYKDKSAKEFQDIIVKHGRWEDDKYFALNRPAYLGYTFYIL